MFVHIGNNIILEEKDIIGIYNIESMKDSEEYKNLIESSLISCVGVFLYT